MSRIPEWTCHLCGWATRESSRKLNHEGYHKLDGSWTEPCPCGRNHAQTERFYVTCVLDSRVAYLAGPCKLHTEALALVDQARLIAEALDVRTVFGAFGTVGIRDGGDSLPPGKLNTRLGLPGVLIDE